MSSYMGKIFCGVAGSRRAQNVVDLAGDVALEAAHDLGLGLAFGESAGHVLVGRFVLVVCLANDLTVV